jgi:hypothetical protein
LYKKKDAACAEASNTAIAHARHTVHIAIEIAQDFELVVAIRYYY